MCQITSKAGDIAINASDKNPCPCRVYILMKVEKQADNLNNTMK